VISTARPGLDGTIIALSDQRVFEAGLESSRRAVEPVRDFLGAYENCAAALERFAEAEAPLRRAVELAADKPEAHRDLGEILAKLGRLDEAVASYRRALDLDPDYPPAHLGLGNVLKTQGKLSEALACFGRASALDPDYAVALSAWFSERQNICDWSDYRENEAQVRKVVGAQPSFATPWTMLGLQSTPEEQLARVRLVAAKLAVPEAALPQSLQPRPRERIRLGYLSADFRQHPVAFAIAGLIDRHDRRLFEVVGYSCRPDDQSAMRACLPEALHRFVDIRDTSHPQAVERIHTDAVDILIDLTGYTAHGRTAIVAHRPAPIRVNYLGYPGTMGADFIDYIVVDRFLVPMEQPAFLHREADAAAELLQAG
jgi:protein O-GlcNAc transferase